MFRCDRNITTSVKKRGKALILPVESRMPVHVVGVDSVSECVVVALDLNHHKKLFIACVYIPSNIPGKFYDDLTAVRDEAVIN
ncbi:hypothetical protein J6590_101577 [Homalodisca vitripennis]|nr:hypothetical protein J6590_096571 [Homalodisca vitripennis]KAG8314046.1 hypothetical protein J6590_101577 [Homalodisca vitripennis]